MSEVTLVRHGQARTGAKDEASYDNLSELGRQQAAWLGQYIDASAQDIDKIIAGPLHRQRQTAEIIGEILGRPVESDERLREIDYFGLAASLNDRHDVPFPTDRESFVNHVPQVLEMWEKGQIDSAFESYAAFEQRIGAALLDAETVSGRVMLVTSGGVISMAFKQIMSLDIVSFGHMMIQIHNASMHRYVRENGSRMLDTFNATPHFDPPERAPAKTYI